MLSQGITNCLDPFIKITVLENEAIKFVIELLRILRERLKATEGVDRLFKCSSKLLFLFIKLSGGLKVVHAEARSRPFYLII